jgi:hypothetical protein
MYPVLKIGDVIIWDLTDFDEADILQLLASDEILQPTKKNEGYVTFCKCDFNIKSLIYERATVEDIITGWTTANEELKLGRLVKWFLRDSLYNLYLTRNLHEEPDVLLLLRLVYWYYRCSRASQSFKLKTTEVKGKLLKGLLKQREKIGKQLDADDATKKDTLLSDLESAISGIIKIESINKELKYKSDNYRNAWFKDVWNVTSELLFAGICAENGFKVTFVLSQQQEYDYDFIVEGYPVQMKSLNTPYDIQSFAYAKRSRKEFVDEGKITYELVLKMILDAIHNKLDEIDNALKRGAKIVFLNGTSNTSGQIFGQLCLEADNDFSIKESMIACIQLVKENGLFVPLIYCATGFRLKYYVNALPFKVPVIVVNRQKKIDRNKPITRLTC